MGLMGQPKFYSLSNQVYCSNYKHVLQSTNRSIWVFWLISLPNPFRRFWNQLRILQPENPLRNQSKTDSKLNIENKTRKWEWRFPSQNKQQSADTSKIDTLNSTRVYDRSMNKRNIIKVLVCPLRIMPFKKVIMKPNFGVVLEVDLAYECSWEIKTMKKLRHQKDPSIVQDYKGKRKSSVLVAE